MPVTPLAEAVPPSLLRSHGRGNPDAGTAGDLGVCTLPHVSVSVCRFSSLQHERPGLCLAFSQLLFCGLDIFRSMTGTSVLFLTFPQSPFVRTSDNGHKPLLLLSSI